MNNPRPLDYYAGVARDLPTISPFAQDDPRGRQITHYLYGGDDAGVTTPTFIHDLQSRWRVNFEEVSMCSALTEWAVQP